MPFCRLFLGALKEGRWINHPYTQRLEVDNMDDRRHCQKELSDSDSTGRTPRAITPEIV